MQLEKPQEVIAAVKRFFAHFQNQVCAFLEEEDQGHYFHEDNWNYEEKERGGGITRVLEGDIIEKAGVNFSHVFGQQLPPAATVNRPDLVNTPFQALGVSIVVHPSNPYVPTTHANIRFFISESGQWWFGGGFDLTPYYGFEEDCRHWHLMAKEACTPFGEDVYPRFKEWCDRYFYLKNRNEPRGIGGIFFDDLNAWGFDSCFSFIKKVGEGFIKGYQPILNKRKQHLFGEGEKQFQLYRRGRYVEFNLLYDRGTLFGLQSQGRTESILMSLPPLVVWKYNWQPKKHSPEEALYQSFLVKRDWV